MTGDERACPLEVNGTAPLSVVFSTGEGFFAPGVVARLGPRNHMTLEVTTIDSLEAVSSSRWNHVVEASDLATVYHRYGWLEAIERGTDHEPRHLVVSKRGEPIAVFPNVRTDLGPASQLTSIVPGFGGPIVTGEETAALDRLLEAVVERCASTTLASTVQTFGTDWIRYNELFEAHGYELRVEWCRFLLALERDWESILAEMDRSRRRGIRRGHEYDVEITDEELTPQTAAAFYESYAKIMDRVGHPELPRSFFLALTGFDDRVKLFSITVDGTDCGSFLYLLDDEQSTVHYLATSVPEEYFEYHAAELLHEHAIRWAIEHGYEAYNFRGAKTDFRDGLFRFKDQFGARVTPTLTWERGLPSPTLPLVNGGRSLYRRYRS